MERRVISVEYAITAADRLRANYDTLEQALSAVRYMAHRGDKDVRVWREITVKEYEPVNPEV